MSIPNNCSYEMQIMWIMLPVMYLVCIFLLRYMNEIPIPDPRYEDPPGESQSSNPFIISDGDKKLEEISSRQ